MTNAFLTREAAPISEALWELLDTTVLGVARSELAGRRLLEIDGPYGLGLKDVALSDEEVADGVFVGTTLPLTYVQRRFTLHPRDLAAYEQEPSSLDLMPLVAATLDVAHMEDELIFKGTSRTAGLTNAKGTLSVTLTDWAEVGAAQGDFIAAVNALDAAGFHGPYAVALSPGRYNQLLRRFETAAVSELDVIGSMATAGVFKASSLDDGGVILQDGKEFAHLIIGQDMSLGFNGPVEGKLEFYVAESLAARVVVPSAVCALKAGGKRKAG
jgi:uncharacterized linocin/CFP29 family protein